MSTSTLKLCYRCSQTLLRTPSLILPKRRPHLTLPTRSFFSKRSVSFKKPTLQLSPPDPNSPYPTTVPPIKRDPGISLGNNGIPVPPVPGKNGSYKRDYTEEKSWAETVFRTLSGGMKSDYLKCIL